MQFENDILSIFMTIVGAVTGILILVEIYLHFAKGRRYYRYVDVITNVQTAVLYNVLGIVALGVIYWCYQFVADNFSIMQQDINSPWAWIGGFILADFCHYWFHRTSHQNNFLWGIHQGHHTSEDFNFSTAVRKGIFQQWVDWPFFIPMAILGFPFFTMFLPLKGLQFAYQFWLHNKFIPKLPWIDWLLVTPSVHRAHHGQNPQYIDKNHAGVFIIWDKLFGTYAEEGEEVVYGTTESVDSFNPIGIQFVWYKNLWNDFKNTKRWRDKLAIFYKETGWRPADVADQPRANHIEDIKTYNRFDIPVPGTLKAYVFIQVIFLFMVFGASGGNNPNQDAQFTEASLFSFSDPLQVFGLVYILLTCFSMGALINRTRYSRILEFVRLGTLFAFGLFAETTTYFGTPTMVHAGLLMIILSTVAFSAIALGQKQAWQMSISNPAMQ
ncbi:sterol desaturase family protein [Aurantivibrio plasticivorans]